MALAAGLDAQQANQQQLGNALQALAARVVPAAQNPQGVGVVVPPPVAQSSARGPITLGAEVVYSGSPIESIVDRMQLVNKKATAENWGDDEKQRLAAYSLSGVALTWQENIGITLQNWENCIQGLKDAFEVRLTEEQCQMAVEGRRQLSTESACSYVMEKLKESLRLNRRADDSIFD